MLTFPREYCLANVPFIEFCSTELVQYLQIYYCTCIIMQDTNYFSKISFFDSTC